MVNGPRSPPGFPREDGVDGGGDPAQIHEEYQPEPLNSLQREELRRRNMDALHTPIAGETPEARALERRVWPTWLNTLVWRISSEHSMSARGNEYPTPVDVNSFRNQLRYIEPRFRI